MRKDRPRPETLQLSIDSAIESLKATKAEVPRACRLADDYQRGFGAGGLGGAMGGDVSRPTERQGLAQVEYVDEHGIKHQAPPDPAADFDEWFVELDEAIAHCLVVATHLHGLLPRGLPPESEGVFCSNCKRHGKMKPLKPSDKAGRCSACRQYRDRSPDGVTERPRELVRRDDLTKGPAEDGATSQKAS